MATGHYARLAGEGIHLLKGADPNKDQTYFLCMLSKEQLSRTVFPVGGLKKTEVREIAKKANIPVYDKKDSTGICFIGERKFRQFLKKYLPANKGGNAHAFRRIYRRARGTYVLYVRSEKRA